ncbi:MAG TPA: HEAT repeat domain-containing protein, partial [Acidobacteriota bacterium]|nr:HEAT repeat domain-containing protein [Acidobacteriota bacterium]
WLSILGQTVKCPNVLEPALEWSHQLRGSATGPAPKVKLTGSSLYTAATHGKDLPLHGGKLIDTIQSNQVYSVLTDPANGTIWICTGSDVFRLNRFLQKTDTLRVCFRNDSEFITNGIKYGKSWYFVSPTYQFSSLMEYDPETAISTPFDVSDGLPEHPISSLVVDEQGLRIEFEPVLKNGVWFVADPTYFYPDTKIFRPISVPRPATETELQTILRLNTPSVLPPMPYLGGQIIKKLVIGQRTFLCGTRGLVVFASDQPMPQLQVTRLIADKPLSQDQLQGKSQPLAAPGSASSKFTPEDLSEFRAMLKAHSDKKSIITAAQACQTFNDQTAIPFLIEALDFEDRETRAAICSALGTLKAIEAIPRIKELCLRTLASNPDSLYFVQGGSGRYSRQLTDLSIEVDWLKLKSLLLKKEPVPGRLPAPAIDFYPLLKQLKPIGPEHLQDLYRLFAQSHNQSLSLEAIQNLANCAETEKSRNFVLLKQLETNPDWEIHVTALAGLATCGEANSQRKILDQLKNTTQKHQRLFLLATLGKISDKSKLKFAVPALRQQLERSKDQQEISLIQTLLTDS